MSNRRRSGARQQNLPAQQSQYTTDSPWTFEWRGETYRLRPARPDYSVITAGSVIDQVTGKGDNNATELRMIVNTLLAAEPDDRTYAAIRSMPMQDWAETMRRWISETAGASPGESLSSSH